MKNRVRHNYFKLRIILVFVICVLFQFCTSTNNILVSFDELEAVLDDNARYDTIFIKAGIVDNYKLTIASSGGKPVYIMPEKYGSVVISGSSSITILNSRNLHFSGFYFDNVIEDNVVIITNSRFVSFYQNYFFRCGNSATSGAIIRLLSNASNNFIFQNTFDGNRTLGIVLMTRNIENDKYSRSNHIYSNIFCNIPSVKSVYPYSNGNGLEAIQLGNGSSVGRWWDMDTRIFNNLFFNIIGDGSEIVSIKSSGNRVHKNTFLDNLSGLTIRYGNNIIVEENIFINTKRGVRVFGGGHSIRGNYFSGGDFGIQLPAATFPSGQFADSTNVYFQSDNIRINNNYFFIQEKAAIVVGNSFSDSRRILPANITISDNSAVLRRTSSKFIDVGQNDLVLRDWRNNRFKLEDFAIGTSNRMRRNLSMGNSDFEFGYVGLDDSPLSLYSPEIGASWKRPVKVKLQ